MWEARGSGQSKTHQVTCAGREVRRVKELGVGEGEGCTPAAPEEGHMAPALSSPGGHPYHLIYLPVTCSAPSPQADASASSIRARSGVLGELDMMGYVRCQTTAQASKKEERQCQTHPRFAGSTRKGCRRPHPHP